MNHVIVNVDDLGLHPAVTRAVKYLASIRTVNSASVLANGPCVTDALLFKDKLFLGAHLNILCGRPISAPSKIPSLVTKDGLFLGDYKTLYFKYLFGQLSLKEIELEWRAQIEHLIAMGIPLAHLDSESHIHAWPKLQAIICRLATDYSVARVRYPYEKQMGFPTRFGHIKAALLRWFIRGFSQHCPKSTYYPYAWGLVDHGNWLGADAFLDYLAYLPLDSNIEIICHPGYQFEEESDIDPEFETLGVSELWLNEFDQLSSPQWRGALSLDGTLLIPLDHSHLG